MKVLVLTGCSSSMREIHEITVVGKREWAKFQGYDFFDIRQWDDWPALVWQKMEWVERMIEHYDRVVWLDGDALVTNTYFAVSHFLNDDAGILPAMVFSADWGGCTPEEEPTHFNTGNFVVRRCAETTAIFAAMWKLGRKEWWDKWGYEQSTLQEIKRTDSNLGRWIKVLPAYYLNAVPRSVHPEARARWEKKMFLAHFTGISNERRLELLKGGGW